MANVQLCCVLIVTFVIVTTSGSSLTCHNGWHLYENSCYNYGHTKVTWANAMEFCRAYSGKLAEIETGEENVFVTTLLKTNQGSQVWIGGTDILREGHWEWVNTGEDFSEFSIWGAGQPDEAGSGEDCLQYMSTSTFFWNDAPCNSLCNFVCEAEALIS